MDLVSGAAGALHHAPSSAGQGRIVDRLTPTGLGGVDDNQHLYPGMGQTRGVFMPSQAREESMAGELGKEASAAKERRKMREERALTKPGPRGKEGGDKK